MKEISIKDLSINPCLKVGRDWLLITAGDEKSFNTMTASWGEMGALWGHSLDGRPTFTIFVRPSRYTHKFVEEKDCYSISFFDDEYKNDLRYLGSHSGRDEDKISKTKLTPTFIDGVPTFKEASMIFICKKIYKGKIVEEGFIEKEIVNDFYKEKEGMYNNDSFHTVYVGEILKVFVK